MDEFLLKHREHITGSLSGFDRLVLRAAIRLLSYAAGMSGFLSRSGVLLKDFGSYVETVSNKIKTASLEAARRLNRPIQYIRSSGASKEDIACRIAVSQPVESGLICVLTCVEPCPSFEVRRDPKEKKLKLEWRTRKCLHLYHYYNDPMVGFMYIRLQTWFPFNIQIGLNGREHLGRQMDRLGMNYVRNDNCFPYIEDISRAQRIMDQLVNKDWLSIVERWVRQVNPGIHDALRDSSLKYYSVVHQSEWATDMMFDNPSALSAIYSPLCRESISSFGSRDVLRFLGKRQIGKKNEIVSSYKCRHEGVRIKHGAEGNSVKMYDKAGSVLRVETTVNHPQSFRTYRAKSGETNGQKEWRLLRKSVVDVPRLAEISDACNRRYLNALSTLDSDRPIRDIVDKVCRRVRWKKCQVRGSNPWSPSDRLLMEIINNGDYLINGFRNRDIMRKLYSENIKDKTEIKRLSARTTRQIRMFRAHGMIRKIPTESRYQVTQRGREIMNAILGYQHITMKRLTNIVA